MTITSIISRGCKFVYSNSAIKQDGLSLKTIHIDNTEGSPKNIEDTSFLEYVACIMLLQNRYKPVPLLELDYSFENKITNTEINLWCDKRESGIKLYEYSWMYARRNYETEVNNLIYLYDYWGIHSYPTVREFDEKLRDCIYIRDHIKLDILPNLYDDIDTINRY